MLYVIVVQFCLAAPVSDLSQCRYVEHETRVQTIEECTTTGESTGTNPAIHESLWKQFNAREKMEWGVYCIEEQNLKDFYGTVGVIAADLDEEEFI